MVLIGLQIGWVYIGPIFYGLFEMVSWGLGLNLALQSIIEGFY